jgi:hypothetical protein
MGLSAPYMTAARRELFRNIPIRRKSIRFLQLQHILHIMNDQLSDYHLFHSPNTQRHPVPLPPNSVTNTKPHPTSNGHFAFARVSLFVHEVCVYYLLTTCCVAFLPVLLSLLAKYTGCCYYYYCSRYYSRYSYYCYYFLVLNRAVCSTG